MSDLRYSVAKVCVLLLVTATPLGAQQTQLTTPFVGVNEGFYEHFGVNWGLRYRGSNGYSFFSFGGPTSALPPFGSFDPNSSARLGFGTRGSGGGFSFSFSAAQGSNRSITSAAPSLTVSNGAVGSIQSGTLRPFVTGLVPVVSAHSVAPVLVSPLRQRIERLKSVGPAAPPASHERDLVQGSPNSPRTEFTHTARPSSAEHGDLSVAEIKRQQTLSDRTELDQLRTLVAEAATAERAGRRGAARIRYQQAARRATGELKQQLLDKLESLAK